MCYSFYELIHEFQTLIAGLMAVIAGVMAFYGINLQVKTALHIDQRNQDRLRRGTASAIAAEILAMAIDIHAFRDVLKSGITSSVQRFYKLQSASFPVFDSDPSAVRHFPPHLANDVVQLFRDYQIALTVWAPDIEKMGNKDRLIQAIMANYDRIQCSAVRLVRALHQEAEMPEQETLKLWAEQVGLFKDFPDEMSQIFGTAPCSEKRK